MSRRLSLSFATNGMVPCHYELVIGNDLWNELVAPVQACSFDRLVVIADAAFSVLHDRDLNRLVAKFTPSSLLTILGGESVKTSAYAEDLMRQLVDVGTSENSLILCFGGGSVGNLITFVAATYLRGIRYIFVPTTLMAMADSAIGHKGALNIGQLKNLCGTFHPPELIYADISFLASLPDIELRSGFAEIIKHAVIEENDLLAKLRTFHFSPMGLTIDELEDLVSETVQSHMRLAASDLRENDSGALLQCGHILGHAIELLCPDLRHGEAIAIGLVQEANIGMAAGLPINQILPELLTNIMRSAGLPTELPKALGPDALLSQLRRSKHRGWDGSVRFVFLEDVGRPHVNAGKYWCPVSSELLHSHFAAILREAEPIAVRKSKRDRRESASG